MLSQLPTPFERSVISEILEYYGFHSEIQYFNIRNVLEDKYNISHALLSDLQAQTERVNSIQFRVQTLHLADTTKHIIYEPTYHFNKYRLISLRADVYQDFKAFDVQKFRNYCRTKEGEALKSGLSANIWGLKEAEALFGAAEDAGYFGGNGSNGWKYIAFTNYLTDLHFKNTKTADLYRFSPYDTLLVNGKLSTLQQLLKTGGEVVRLAVLKHILRRLNIPIPEL